MIPLDPVYHPTVGYSVKSVCHIQIIYRRLFGVNSNCDCTQLIRHTSSASLPMEKTILASVDKFVFHEICGELLFTQASQDSRGNRGTLDPYVIGWVRSYVLPMYVDHYRHFPLGGESIALKREVEYVYQN